MGHLEREIAAPVAEADRIAALVAALPSDTVQAPRILSERIIGRLKEVAASNGGQVPLHGRLFAQWMHHAFPRECPHSHESGTTNPQTPDEWMKAAGQESSKHSEAELLRHVESEEPQQQLQQKRPRAEENREEQEEQELPWSEAEELLVTRTQAPASAQTTGSRTPLVFLLLASFPGILALSSYAIKTRGVPEDDGPLKPGLRGKGFDWTPIAFFVLSIVVLLLDLMDTMVFGGALLGGCVMLSLPKGLPQRPKKCA